MTISINLDNVDERYFDADRFNTFPYTSAEYRTRVNAVKWAIMDETGIYLTHCVLSDGFVELHASSILSPKDLRNLLDTEITHQGIVFVVSSISPSYDDNGDFGISTYMEISFSRK